MLKDFVSAVVVILLILFLFFISPMYSAGQIELARAQDQALNTVQLFLDKIADTREITDEDLDDFSLALASILPLKYEITREAKQVNPDPASTTIPKATYTSYVPVDNYKVYDQGDIVTIRVEQVGSTLYQTFTTTVLRMYIGEVDFKLSRMVR